MEAALDTVQLLRRVDELIQMGNGVLSTEIQNPLGKKFVDLNAFYEFSSASISFIIKLFGKDHPYFKDFSEKVNAAMPTTTKRGLGMLQAIRGEIEHGWLTSTIGLISADIFNDFLEMAEHLLNEGYKDSAAVISGSALEKHLKNLCEANNIETTIERDAKKIPKKADAINSDLARAKVYSKLDQKSVTFWLGIRNNAAHGQYEEYNNDQVKIMIFGISEFIGRTTV